MIIETEALKLALEALEHAAYCVQKNYCPDKMGHDWDDAIASIKEALAQPVQEPVAYIDVEQRRLQWAKPMSWNTPTTVNLPKIPLYTAPPQPVQEPVAWEQLHEHLAERYFCQRCGKPVNLTTIHTCTPPRGNT